MTKKKEKHSGVKLGIIMTAGGFYGGENVVYNITKYLTRHCNVYLFINEEMNQYCQELEDVTVINLGRFYYRSNKLLRWLYYRKACYNGSRVIKKEIKKNRIGIINLHMNGSVMTYFPLFFELKDLPVVWAIHLSNPNYLKFIHRETFLMKLLALSRHLFEYPIYLIACKYSNAIICYSLAMEDYLKKRSDPMKIYLLDKGVNTKAVQSAPFLDSDDYILFVGRLLRLKFVEEVICAMKIVVNEFPNIKLKIIGTGHMEKSLKKLVKDLNLEKNVEFLGFIPPPELYSYYRSAKLCVLPIGKHSYSLTQLEAKAAGTPIVTSNTPEISRIIKNNKNGILVDPTPKKMANAIIYLLKNPDIMEEMSRTNLQEAKKNDWEMIVKQYVKVFDNVLSKAQNS